MFYVLICHCFDTNEFSDHIDFKYDVCIKDRMMCSLNFSIVEIKMDLRAVITTTVGRVAQSA